MAVQSISPELIGLSLLRDSFIEPDSVKAWSELSDEEQETFCQWKDYVGMEGDIVQLWLMCAQVFREGVMHKDSLTVKSGEDTYRRVTWRDDLGRLNSRFVKEE